ncbi:dehydrogenase E1 and transketolase domain-containing protein 1 [Dendrothele bispora CBS 962.96]|uniref:Dehydrogenase E1 and transketolase domain-containing protein 1 n=1 Tax=Dendrothele bispora (strain CBS 962.96) TaxID=1314807 RepID=A0A4S8MEE1_DENBC|nr:dehydrogenase E1 and transketolase domain-containing protein 1 [Dendrothele bispora CBS 962.96]
MVSSLLRSTTTTRLSLGKSVNTVLVKGRRTYHDESFGYRKPPTFAFPDYTNAQLQNRHTNAALLRYVDSVRIHAHRAARIDPLDLIHRESEVAALNPGRYGLPVDNPEAKFNVNGIIWTHPDVNKQRGSEEELMTMEEINRRLREVYVGRIGYEYMHSPSKTERLWFSHLLESNSVPPSAFQDSALRKRIHGLLARSEVFDNFLQLKFPNLKRYGLEGGESMLPALDSLFSAAARAALSHVIVAMPHRGRLNLLTDPELLKYDCTGLFYKIRGGAEWPEELIGEAGGVEGDVLSHLVSSAHLQYTDTSNEVKVSLLPNPSHLEAVNAVALGKTRAKQYSLLRTSPETCQLGDKVMCVQLHGDASFTGQGVVMESLGLSGLPHYTSGGTVHLVVDNNIGYTTPIAHARSSQYCSDVGKMIGAPVLHVNGDHPEDVARAMEIAFKYRQYFRKDIIVDLLVYRRWGHNELDVPNFTSPLMYEKIAARKSVPKIYEEKMISDEVLTEEQIDSVRKTYRAHLDSALGGLPQFKPSLNDTVSPLSSSSSGPEMKGQWSSIVWPTSPSAVANPDTGVEVDILRELGKISVKVPEGFEVHEKLKRHVKSRVGGLEGEKGVDWATGEALAFASLMLEGNDVRISGQDVGRGTFSQRHAMLVDQKTEKVVVPLNEFLPSPKEIGFGTTEGVVGKLELANSSLSEMAVLGFEYGASWERPDLLPIWEAQFGDFFNGAQIIIDTFVSSAETKWLKQSGITLLLPHGLDGAGPEHSSCRLERWLQLTNDRYSLEDSAANTINMHVVFPTTPAQFFHLLRRQMKRNYRKPLVVAGPKALLRLPAAASSLSEFAPGTSFRPVLSDPLGNEASAKRVLIVTGKLYYELVKERKDRELENEVSIVRIEEIAPFPFEELGGVLEKYGLDSDGKEVWWVQEEPRNQGVWTHVRERLGNVQGLEGVNVRYWGRSESALPAPGIGRMYKEQQERVVKGAFGGL